MDHRLVIGFLFITGYYGTLWVIGFSTNIPAANLGLIKDGLLQLGPPVGAIIFSLFRNGALDEKREENTAAAFMALSAPPSTEPQSVKVINTPGEPVPTHDTTEEGH